MKLAKKFKMNDFVACAAAYRPPYCKFETNVCCFSCEYNEECTAYAKKNNIKILPCTPAIFEVHEICEFAI